MRREGGSAMTAPRWGGGDRWGVHSRCGRAGRRGAGGGLSAAGKGRLGCGCGADGHKAQCDVAQLAEPILGAPSNQQQ